MCSFFFFNDTATTEIYTLSLHDALPISSIVPADANVEGVADAIVKVVDAPFGKRPFRVHYDPTQDGAEVVNMVDRKSTRLNSSHLGISYAVFCLKKKKKELLHISLYGIV